MKKLAVVLFSCLGGLSVNAHAANPACDAKATEIETQIEHARTHGNTQRQRGLEEALKNLRANCTDAKLIEDKREEVEDQQDDVKDVEEEISEKRAEGKADKVQKLERKLTRERERLEVLQDELSDLEDRTRG